MDFTQGNNIVITARVALGMMPVINAKVTYVKKKVKIWNDMKNVMYHLLKGQS